MRITLTKIKRLNPCHSRLANFVKHYPKYSGTLKQFLALDKITDTDKRWVYFRLLPKKYVAKCAADIAGLVLDVFETKYPNDPRPRNAIKAARKGNKKEAYAAANAAIDAANAAYGAYAATAAYAAYAAAYAAYAVNAADAAAYAAAYAVTAAYAVNATNADSHITSEHKIMLKWAKKMEKK